MTVRELRELLMKFDDDAVIFEECRGEHRKLVTHDIRPCTQIFNSENGEVENGKYVVLEGWS